MAVLTATRCTQDGARCPEGERLATLLAEERVLYRRACAHPSNLVFDLVFETALRTVQAARHAWENHLEDCAETDDE